MNKNLLLKTFRNTIAAAAYIFAVSQIMQNGDRIFGVEDNMLAPFGFLLMFVLSAAVVGGLIIGYPIYLFFDGKKKESVTALFYSVGWLALYTVIVLSVLALLK